MVLTGLFYLKTNMKTTILILLLLDCGLIRAQGIYNNGAIIKTGNKSYINLFGTACNFTNTSNGNLDHNGLILLQGNWRNDVANGIMASDTNGLIIFNGTNNQIISGLFPTNFERITLENQNGIQLQTSIAVERKVTINAGKIILNKNEFTLGSIGYSGVLIGIDSNRYFVAGDSSSRFIRYCINDSVNYLFPIGDASNYTPVTVSFNNTNGLNNASKLVLSVINTMHPLKGSASNYLKRYWTVKPISIAANANYNITYLYKADDVTGIEAGIFPYKYDAAGWLGTQGSGANSTMGVGAINSGNHTVVWNGLFSFSDFTAFGEVSPLPISLLSFEAYANNENVETKWSTITEINNDYFTIEKSIDAASFIEAGMFKGAGNSNERLDYIFIDSLPFNGYSYYRLKQTDFDGNFSYSGIKSVLFIRGESNAAMLIAYPNPTNINGVYINSSEIENDFIKIKLLNIIGSVVLEKTVWIDNNNDAQFIGFEGISEGVYFITINNGTTEKTTKLMILKQEN
jgi:hypothetical protein